MRGKSNTYFYCKKIELLNLQHYPLNKYQTVRLFKTYSHFQNSNMLNTVAQFNESKKVVSNYRKSSNNILEQLVGHPKPTSESRSNLPKPMTKLQKKMDDFVQYQDQEDILSTIPDDNINLCFVGGVSTGKSTILNAIFCEELTQCKIKRTTMIPTVYIENENDAPNLDIPEQIFAQISQKNKEIIEKTESGVAVSDAEYTELQFNVGKLDINILPDSYVNVYDIPGLNDARTKSIYYKYLQKNFHRFNLVVFIVDIHSGLNTSDEADILNFIADHTRLQFDTNNKKIYTLVVVNKADDMQLVPESEDDELEITGELGEMFEQVQNTVVESFKRRDRADHLVGIIPLCAIDSYLYRMTQKHGDKFKLTPEQILKIGINENGKKFSTLKPKTQETKVREILNDKDFVDTMITLSGFGHFEKRLHAFLSQNNTGTKIRVENLMFKLRKLPQIRLFVSIHIQQINKISELLSTHFQIFNAIIKIDQEFGNDLVMCALINIKECLQAHIRSELNMAVTIRKVNDIVTHYDKFRSQIIAPYFAQESADYPEYLCTQVLGKICDVLKTCRIDPNYIKQCTDTCKHIGILTRTTFEQLNDCILNNDYGVKDAFIHSTAENDDSVFIQHTEIGDRLGVDMTSFLRFGILSRICCKSFYTEEQLFQKRMIYKSQNEIPILTYLECARTLSPRPEWAIHGISKEITETANILDMYYLAYISSQSS